MSASPELYRKMGLKFTRIFVSSQVFTPEVKLWRAVVVNAIEDCTNLHSDRKNSLQKIYAHNWITSRCKDFDEVCYWGQLDPDDIEECYTTALKNKKIIFNERQVKWYSYDKLYKQMIYSEPAIRKLLRKKLDKMRFVIKNTPTIFCSTIFVSAFS